VGAKDSEKTSSDSEKTSSDSDPDKDPYEPRKKKSRIDNDYIPQPAGPMKDKDDYYNMGVYAVSATAAAAATAANNAAKYLIEDSGSNSADTTDTTDTADTDEDGLDKEIDVSIRNIIQHIIYDKNKDD
jgi:hypothetical protein